MKDLGIYFTWPLFVARLLAVLVSLPVLIIISMFLTGQSYVDDKINGIDTSVIDSLVESFKTVFINSGLFIIGGRKIIPR